MCDDFRLSIAEDKDEYLFALTESRGDVAMVLIERSGQLHVNEQAREKLKALWSGAYERNMKQLIPVFVQQLSERFLLRFLLR